MTTVENFKCVFCNETFEEKEILQEHFRKHGSPDFDKGKTKVQNEVPTSTAKTEEIELVSCDVCEEVFPTISKAITHKHKIHPDHDTKHFCPWCGKLFTMKHLYNKHIQSSHNGVTNVDVKDFHCDICSVYFFIPSAMLHHNKFFHRQENDFISPGSSKKVKLFSQELVAILYCPFCGDEYNNKVNLHKHMEDDHGDENQSPEDVLRCPLCEAFFYHLDAYELHLTFHSTEDLYNEPNEMANEISEFSLETVPPLMEKVQSANMESVDDFLEIIQKEPSEQKLRVKPKKHKKHKKSKKESITLDEFLNMNKELFGDGLNVQGIEEVPSQMVLKRKYKTKKPESNVETKAIKQDLAKLKRQGIVIKSSKITPSVAENKILTNQKTNDNKALSKVDPNDVVTKIMNQGNNQIKIVKTSLQKDSENKQNNYQSNKIDSSSDCNTNTDSPTERDLEEERNEKPDTEKGVDDKINMKEKKIDESNDPANKGENKVPSKEKDDCSLDQTESTTGNISESNLPLQPIQSIEMVTIQSMSQNDEIKHNVKTDSGFINDEDNCDENFEDKPISEDEEINLKEDNAKIKTLQSLNLKKGITIKHIIKNNAASTFANFNSPDMESTEKDIVQNKSLETLKGLSKHITVKPSSSSPSSNNYQSKTEDMLELNEKQTRQENTKIAKSVVVQKHAEILKRLTDVTAKPLPNKTGIVANKTGNIKVIKKEPIKRTVENDIETLHIDDSDSDVDTDHVLKQNQSNNESAQNSNSKKSTEIAKNVTPKTIRCLSKNIIVKAVSQQSSKFTEIQSNNGGKESKKMSVSRRTFESKNVHMTQSNNKLSEEQKNLHNTINQLRRHITVKSKNNPQLNYNRDEDVPDEDVTGNKETFEDTDYDSDSSVDKHKISEMNVDEVNDTDYQANEHKSDDEANFKIDSPSESNHEIDEANDDELDEFDDVDNKIKANPIKNNNQQRSSTQHQLNSLSNLSKELTVKSVKPTPFIEDKNDLQNEELSDTETNAKPVSVRPTCQKQQVKKSIVQASQKASTSSNQVNTVKTVKTYQSQTVVEEVTTTVTKTIRTVNTQEFQNDSQTRTIGSQKILKKPTNNIQGALNKQVSPIIGAKVRHSTPRPRANVPKSAGMIATRPRLNTPQMPSPSNIRKPQQIQNWPRATGTPNKPVIAMPRFAAIGKRLSEDTGPFSCFKKSKESLIPVQDIPNTNEDGSVQYSSSQSKSTNYTKIVKASSAGTSQVRSESSMSSQQHFAKLSNVSGLKIVKTSTKQAVQVEEKCEVNSPKNNTIAALEKLQRQGLLVKKPRLEIFDSENHSQSEDEENNDDED